MFYLVWITVPFSVTCTQIFFSISGSKNGGRMNFCSVAKCRGSWVWVVGLGVGKCSG